MVVSCAKPCLAFKVVEVRLCCCPGLEELGSACLLAWVALVMRLDHSYLVAQVVPLSMALKVAGAEPSRAFKAVEANRSYLELMGL